MSSLVSQRKVNNDIGNIVLGITTCATNILRDIRHLSVKVNHIFEEIHLGISLEESAAIQGDHQYLSSKPIRILSITSQVLPQKLRALCEILKVPWWKFNEMLEEKTLGNSSRTNTFGEGDQQCLSGASMLVLRTYSQALPQCYECTAEGWSISRWRLMVSLTRCLDVLASCAVLHSWKCSECLAGLHCLFWRCVSRYVLRAMIMIVRLQGSLYDKHTQVCASLSEYNVKTLRVE